MHTIKLEIGDSVYTHIMFLLKNLKSKDLKITEVLDDEKQVIDSTQESEVRVFSNHTANLLEDWYDNCEDNVWK